MRRLLLLLTVLLAAPAWSVTVDFENLPGLTPIAYAPDTVVPTSAQLKSLVLPTGEQLRFSSRRGKGYAALVTHDGQTSVVAVNRKGKISTGNFLDITLKKAHGVGLESIQLINGTARLGDDPSTPGTVETDFVLGYDGAATAFFFLRTSNGTQIGSLQQLITSPQALVFTGIPRRIVRVSVAGALTIGDVSVDAFQPAAPAVPEPAVSALLAAGAAALGWLARRRAA